MGSRGFSLAELAVSLAVLCALTAALLPVVARGTNLARLQPAVTDLDQRLRVVQSTLQRALEGAGAGNVSASLSASLSGRVPMVFPARRGVSGGDAADVARTDRFTVLSLRPGSWDVALAVDMASPSSLLLLDLGPPCPAADDRCGFRAGDLGVVGNRFGEFDLFEVRAAGGGVLDHAPAELSRTYGTGGGARVGLAVVRQFTFDAGRRQIRLGDGVHDDLPLLDDVDEFACTYYGIASPPEAPRPPLGTASCLFNADGTNRLASLAGPAAGWVELPVALFRDGPFCGDSGLRFDADLFRIRRVVVRVRVGRAAPAPDGLRSELQQLSFQREVLVDVVIRNLAAR